MKKGFTLIELLIVIIIIATLIALLLPALTKALCAGKETAMSSIIHNIDTACQNYSAFYGTFPHMGAAATIEQTFYSRYVVNQLKALGPRKIKYMEFDPNLLDAEGDIKNSVISGQEIMYRNNDEYRDTTGDGIPDVTLQGTAAVTDPLFHNIGFIDIWTADCQFRDVAGQKTYINNWRWAGDRCPDPTVGH